MQSNKKILYTVVKLLILPLVIYIIVIYNGIPGSEEAAQHKPLQITAKLPKVLRWPKQSAPEGSAIVSILKRMGEDLRKGTSMENYTRYWGSSSPPNRSSTKTILFYNSFMGSDHYYFGEGREPFVSAGCPESNCFASSNKSVVKPETADAIIWHHWMKSREMKEKRSSHSRLVYFSMESPTTVEDKSIHPVKNLYNYTMSYSLDADIYHPYGIFVRRSQSQTELESINYADGRTKMAVWFASHCTTDSAREQLVKKLQEFISVDIYGKCGSFTCPKDDINQNSESCLKHVARHYKFYFSFENSLCKDYITEKFFATAQYNIVPVVYGLGSYDQVAPPHSFINVLNFATAKDLAGYLQYLDSNDTAYNEYFRWKSDFVALSEYKQFKTDEFKYVSWCQLCEKLHSDGVAKSYSEIGKIKSVEHCLYGSDDLIQSFIKG